MNILTLGDFYVSDFIKDESDYANRKKYPLNLVLDEETGAVKLTSCPPHNQMWGKYWYRSGTNASMTKELRGVVEEILSRIQWRKDDIWLDIACNDGSLLKAVPSEMIRLGIDPADSSFYNESSKFATVIQDYFSFEAYKKTGYGDRKAKVITTIAMFYDLENPHPFIEDINKVLDDNGVWVIQLSYTPLMVKQLAFDNICHEHFFYYSLSSLKKLFAKHNLDIVDASLNDTNGGSIRVYLQKACRNVASFSSTPFRDVCNFRVASLLKYEEECCDISKPEVWKAFEKQIFSLKNELLTFIKAEKAKGKTICGYGASTKGNTLLQLFGLDHTLIDCIAERSHYKYGLKTVGTNIPIVSEQKMRDKNPDYLLVLPWHFINEFVDREINFLAKGGKFIVPCPKFEIID